MPKFLVFLLLSIITISMLQTMVMARNGHGGHHQHGGHHHHKNTYGQGSLKLSQCGGECNRRCSKTQYHNACIKFCNKCCKTCLCVPPGFYGNKQVCPCYNNWKTKEGGPKCP